MWPVTNKLRTLVLGKEPVSLSITSTVKEVSLQRYKPKQCGVVSVNETFPFHSTENKNQEGTEGQGPENLNKRRGKKMQRGIHAVLFLVMMPCFIADDQGPPSRPGAVGPKGVPAKLPYCPVRKEITSNLKAMKSSTRGKIPTRGKRSRVQRAVSTVSKIV